MFRILILLALMGLSNFALANESQEVKYNYSITGRLEEGSSLTISFSGTVEKSRVPDLERQAKEMTEGLLEIGFQPRSSLEQVSGEEDIYIDYTELVAVYDETIGYRWYPQGSVPE